CLGLADCVRACDFDALRMDEKTGLPVVDEDKCTACGACVEACPRDIIELRVLGKKDRKIFVSCINQDPAGPAKKACSVACIGCGLCYDACKFDAITMLDNLAYIDDKKCALCRACVEVCPTNAIWEVNFPPRKPKPTKKKSSEKKENIKTKVSGNENQSSTLNENKIIDISELQKENKKTNNEGESTNKENKN
ncbi:MAG TPA: 4Fe-4S dicluster domain-containing protein, partial [Candidatus Atribacteria bacterium]|nr:4Fe-4S dicluster domain-containing protein [Candidatus Atribacteria bacterium]